MKVARIAAIALAASVTSLTSLAQADEPAHAPAPALAVQSAPAAAPPVEATSAGVTAPAAAAAAAADQGTPLALRPSRPLALAPEQHPASAGWKIVAFLVALGGAALWLYKRAKGPLAGLQTQEARLTIVRRASLGLRSELVVVDVEGQRLLLGVTPHSIQSLAALDVDAGEGIVPMTGGAPLTLGAAGALRADPGVSDKFSAMLDAADRRAPARDRAQTPASGTSAAAVAAVASPNDDDVAGQARGLLALRGRR